MKPNLSNSYKNSQPHSIPVVKRERIYPANAKVIHLSEYRLTRKQKRQEFPKSLYFIKRNKAKLLVKNSLFFRCQQVCANDSVIKWLFVCSTVCSLLAIFFFIGQSIIK